VEVEKRTIIILRSEMSRDISALENSIEDNRWRVHERFSFFQERPCCIRVVIESFAFALNLRTMQGADPLCCGTL
jgi:hypothetical protein